MESIQSELDNLFNDNEKEGEDIVPIVRLASDLKRKGKKEPKEPKPKQPKPEKIRTTPLIRTTVNNETKFHDKIKDLCNGLKAKGHIRIICVFGNSGLMAYWFKTYCPEAEVILNDSDNIVSKLDTEVRDKFLKGIVVQHKEIDEYLAPETDVETYLVLNPREFDIKVIEFLTHNFNLIICGSTKNKNNDYVYIFNNLISKLDTKYTPIPYSALAFATETDYILVNVQ